MYTWELLYESDSTMQVLSTNSTSQTHNMFLVENAASLALNTGINTRLENHTNNVKEQVKLLYPISLSYFGTMAGKNCISI